MTPNDPPADVISWRDKLARVLCETILTTIATKWYRESVDGLLKLGIFYAGKQGLRPADFSSANKKRRSKELDDLEKLWREE